ncbi:DUF4258 domain-containing protein [Candidatus Poribacteria bacterium]|nr:DUF4258 domain-containing protein [Candidatus Poribacteria bacterium]
MISITPDFIRAEVENQTYEISLHADDERIADGLTVSQLESVLSDCQIIEHYPDDPRGESCLVLGFTPEGTAVHVVCGKNRSGHLMLITVYIPTMPKWIDPYTRNR